MGKFVKKFKPENKTVNRQGLPAYSLDDSLHLLALLNTVKVEDQYYRSENEVIKEVHDLIDKLSYDPYFLAQMIVWSRCKGEGMRSINHLAAAFLAPYISGKSWAKDFYGPWKKTYGGCIYRLDDMAEIIAVYSSSNKCKLTNAMKKGFAKVLQDADDYTLLKYKKAVKNVLNLCHANPKLAKAESQLNGGYDVKTITAIKKGLPVKANTWETNQSLIGQQDLTENEKQEKKAENWNQMLKENSLGILAALRNIRNILKVVDDKETINLLCALVSNPSAILNGKIMPYQIDTAYQIVMDQFLTYQYSSLIQSALIKGYEESLPNLKLFGKTCVMIDASGSMHNYCFEFDSQNRSRRINARAIDKASLIAATIVKNNDCDIIRFGTNAEFFQPDLKKTVFDLAKDIANKNMGMTNLETAFNLILVNQKEYDRIIVISDNECNCGRAWIGYKNYRKFCDPYVYAIDLAAYGTVPIKNPGKVEYYFGYGYSFFDDISRKEFRPEDHLEEIKQIRFT